MEAFGDFYRDKTILVTGHTGFKGSWLCSWLRLLGTKKVIGYSLAPPTNPSSFQVCHLQDDIESLEHDIRDFASLKNALQLYQPDLVFHLAAQSLVPYSLEHPLETLEVNLMGTANLLEACLQTESVKAVISITSDKCYLNNNWVWGYRETDKLGGHDPYSTSKACAELAIATYQSEEFQEAKQRRQYLPIASVRAGNVIGGGDWSSKRLVPDVIRSIAGQEDILLRSPAATRPWQHVLEPLSGYLWLGANINRNHHVFVSGWNFGPVDQSVFPVKDVVEKIKAFWPSPDTNIITTENEAKTEAKLLSLDCSKACNLLEWTGTWQIDEALQATTDWFRSYYQDDNSDMYEFTKSQIKTYTLDARNREQTWALGDFLDVKL
ncbi:MAG: CDP-glucose 4,6-dehydratase [Candidatus Azotimanducaceae bacterium]|jgi:CDP-glucose 4,6-dehydratase